HSRRTLTIIRENIGFSLGIKALFVVLTFAGYATLWGAIAADVGASVLVVMNALRLLRPVGSRREAGGERIEGAGGRMAAGATGHGH
ncbi:MAG: heavy metal translocating P-type ATPase, partial [Geminicoccales bacterium]